MTESFFPEESETPQEQKPAETPEQITEPAPKPSDDDTELSEEGRLAAIMSYIPFLCFVPLMNVNWKENKEARFHARQGIILFLMELAAVVMLFDDLARFALRAVLILAAALSAAGVYFALQGKRFHLPIIGTLAEKSKL